MNDLGNISVMQMLNLLALACLQRLSSIGGCFIITVIFSQAELKRPRFEEGLEGVLDLANSISLTDTLAAANLDSGAHSKGPTLTTEAMVQSVEGLVADAASIV